MANQHTKDLDAGMPRNIKDEWLSTRQVVVISGVRRCGKSYFLRQIREKNNEKDYYFRFDDERLINFSVEDFETLDTVNSIPTILMKSKMLKDGNCMCGDFTTKVRKSMSPAVTPRC